MMMENAARSTAAIVRQMFGEKLSGKQIVLLCGKGNNGGDGITAARHLKNWGAKPVVVLATEDLREIPKLQLEILEKMDVHALVFDRVERKEIEKRFETTDFIIDALLGYDLHGAPREPIATIIKLANKSGKPILAVDIPSGLHGDTGKASDPTIQAFATLTLALPKVGLVSEKAKKYVGELFVSDLSVPRQVYEKIGIEVPLLFENSEVVRIG